MTDRIDPRQNPRPTPGQESAALAALADLAERGGLLHNRATGWTAVPLMAGTEDEPRRAIVAGMSYMESYRGTDRDTGLRVWRGRILGWNLAVSQYDPTWPAGPAAAAEPDMPTSWAAYGLARVLAELPEVAADLLDPDWRLAAEEDFPAPALKVPAQRSYAPAPLVDLAAVRDARRAVDQVAEVTA